MICGKCRQASMPTRSRALKASVKESMHAIACDTAEDSLVSVAVEGVVCSLDTGPANGCQRCRRPCRTAEIGRLRENSKLLGFGVSLNPSRVTAKPIHGDLKDRVSRQVRPAYVVAQPGRSPSDASPRCGVTRVPNLDLGQLHGGISRREKSGNEPDTTGYHRLSTSQRGSLGHKKTP